MHAQGTHVDNYATAHLKERCCRTLSMFGRQTPQQGFVRPPNRMMPRVDQHWLPSPPGRAKHAASSSPALGARPTTVTLTYTPIGSKYVGGGKELGRRSPALVKSPSSLLREQHSSKRNRPPRGSRIPRPCDEQQQQHQLSGNRRRKRNSREAPTACGPRALKLEAIEEKEKPHGNVLREDHAVIAGRQRAFVRTMEKLGVGRRGEEIMKLIERTASDGSPPFNLYMHNACITALARCDRWRQAVAVLDSMRRAATEADAQRNANDHNKTDHPDDCTADGAAASMGRVVVRPDVVSYSAAITALGRGCQRHRALELLRDMREEGVAPNVVTYNAAAHACIVKPQHDITDAGSKSKEPQQEEGWSLILALMKEMRVDGISPDAFTFSTAITACGRAGRWELALHLLNEMASSAGQDQPRQSPPLTVAAADAVPDIVAINAAIAACGRAGQWRHALDLLGRMTVGVPAADEWSGSRDGSVLVGSILRLTDPNDENASVAAILKDEDLIVGSGSGFGVGSRVGLGTGGSGLSGDIIGGADAPSVAAHPSPWPSAEVVSFNAAMEACARAGRWREGVALLPSMRTAGIRPDVRTYAAALACFRAGGQWESALDLLEKMEDFGFGSRGREDGNNEFVIPDIGCYGMVMCALGEAGEWERSLELLRRLQRREGIRETLTVTALPRAAPAAASAATAGGPNLVCYNAALSACARAGASAPALALLEEMESLGVFDAVSFNCAIRACRGQGQWRKAIELMDRMMRGDRARGASVERILPLPDVYSFSSAITACGASGQAEVAVELLRRMENAAVVGVEPNVVVYNAAIATFVRAVSRLDAAAKYPEVCFSRADSLGEGNGRNVMYEEASKRGGEMKGSWRRAWTLVTEMREAGVSPNVETYNTVLAVCQRAGAWEGALEVLEEMKRGQEDEKEGTGIYVPSPDVISFNTAMGACGKAGRWCEALALLEEMPKRGLEPDAISYNTAAAACAREREWDLALQLVDSGRRAGAFEGREEASECLGARKERIGRASRVASRSLNSDRFHAALEKVARRKY